MKTQQAEKEDKLMGFVWEAKATDGRGRFRAVEKADILETTSGELEESVGRLSILMERMIRVVLSIIVGAIAIAMHMPIFKIGTEVTHGG